MNNPQIWQAIAAIIVAYAALLGGLYAVVTRPLEGRLNGMQSQLSGFQSQLNDITQRLGRIEAKLDDHAERITRLEERTSPIRH